MGKLIVMTHPNGIAITCDNVPGKENAVFRLFKDQLNQVYIYHGVNCFNNVSVDHPELHDAYDALCRAEMMKIDSEYPLIVDVSTIINFVINDMKLSPNYQHDLTEKIHDILPGSKVCRLYVGSLHSSQVGIVRGGFIQDPDTHSVCSECGTDKCIDDFCISKQMPTVNDHSPYVAHFFIYDDDFDLDNHHPYSKSVTIDDDPASIRDTLDAFAKEHGIELTQFAILRQHSENLYEITGAHNDE